MTNCRNWPKPSGLSFYETGIFLLAFVGLLAVIYAEDRLTAIISLGIQGFAVALIFILFGAPDLAFTQFMVETLSVVILALVMTRLTLHKTDHRPFLEKSFDFAVALIAGRAFTALLLAVVAGSRSIRLFQSSLQPIAEQLPMAATSST